MPVDDTHFGRSKALLMNLKEIESERRKEQQEEEQGGMREWACTDARQRVNARVRE